MRGVVRTRTTLLRKKRVRVQRQGVYECECECGNSGKSIGIPVWSDRTMLMVRLAYMVRHHMVYSV